MTIIVGSSLAFVFAVMSYCELLWVLSSFDKEQDQLNSDIKFTIEIQVYHYINFLDIFISQFKCILNPPTMDIS